MTFLSAFLAFVGVFIGCFYVSALFFFFYPMSVSVSISSLHLAGHLAFGLYAGGHFVWESVTMFFSLETLAFFEKWNSGCCILYSSVLR